MTNQKDSREMVCYMGVCKLKCAQKNCNKVVVFNTYNTLMHDGEF